MVLEFLLVYKLRNFSIFKTFIAFMGLNAHNLQCEKADTVLLSECIFL